MSTYSTTKKQPKVARLVGKLGITINGEPMDISDKFIIQTDLAYSGMSVADQETTMKAIAVALAGSADIQFNLTMEAEEVKSKSNQPKKKSTLDLMLEAASKPTEVELLEAVVRDDEATANSKSNALGILGATKLQPTYGVE